MALPYPAKKTRKHKVMSKIYQLIIFIFISASLTLGGCTRSVKTNQNGDIFPSPFAPSPDTESPLVTEKTITATQFIQEAIELLETGYMGEDLLIFSINLPKELDQDFYGKVLEEEYECTRQEELPDRLYCFGHVPEDQENPLFSLYSLADKKLIWQTEFEYPDLISE